MHWKYALRFGTAAAAAILLSARANAADISVIDGIDYEKHADAVLVHYHLADGYDADDIRVGKSGKVLRIVLPGARLRGSRKKWPRPIDNFVKGSFAYQLTPTTVRHKLRLAGRIDADDVTIRRFGNVIVARIPKRSAGKAVAMAPADAPDAKPVAPKTVPTPGLTPIPLTTAAAITEPEDVQTPAPAKKGADAGRERLLRDLFAAPTPAAPTEHEDRLDTDTAEVAAPESGPLAELGADLPDINPVTWLLIMTALGLLLFAVRRKTRFAGQSDDSGRTITVLDRKVVAGKTGVALLEAAGRLVLVGTSDSGLTPLADLGPSDDDFQAVVRRTSALPPEAILPPLDPAPVAESTPTDLSLNPSPSPSAAVTAKPSKVPHSAAMPAIAAVDAFRAKVAALRSA